MRFIRGVAVLAAVVQANTEVVIFDFTGGSTEGALAPLVPFTSEFQFSNATVATLSLPLSNASAGKYLARVCWPASFPADLSIEFNQQTQAVVVVGSKEDIVTLQGESHEVPFDVHLSPMKYGLIPVDVIPVVQVTIIMAALSLYLVYALLKYI